MNERTAEATTTVEEDGIRVEKSFTDDAFPVPAVMYELASDREDAVRVRIVDRIPDSFPMDRVGFHPDYESENWTAYKDHRVEFERVLEPQESVETVFGIRDDDPELEGFLGAPVIEHVPVGEEIEDVLGTDETDAVREVLSGDRETLPGMEDSTESEPTMAESATEESTTADPTVDGSPAAESETETPADPVPGDEESQDIDPREFADGTTSAVTPRDEGTEQRDESVETADGPAEDLPDETADAERVSDEPTDGSPSEPVPDASQAGIASALADEIRSGEVDEADLNVLQSELDVGVPRSVDVRISRLQSSVADIEAYADALAEFIDEEGTAREILDGIDARVDDVEDEVGALDGRVTAGERAHGELATDVIGVEESVDEVESSVETVESSVEAVESSVEAVESDVSGLQTDMDDVEGTVGEVENSVSAVEESVHEVKETVGGVVEDVAGVEGDVSALGDDVDDIGDDIETLYEEVDDAAAAAERTDGRVDDVEDRLGRFDEEFDDLWDDLAEIDTRLTDIESRLGDDLEDVDAELASINDHLEELEAFRKRLNEAFGP